MSQDGISRFILSIWRICKIVPFLSDKATPRLALQPKSVIRMAIFVVVFITV